ncbi:hypothetical protein JX265_011038 [Neoarthrinium moseri]|uniref:Sodium/calcium exchanger membrane region domain-containing protein n=2 Tax=Neoarthrinium moseri TaxID=1658444 RepID=A0A9P9WD46_9PEZI|nr:hypothetical protein JX265_011038 [Neoarthrinium moseri]
MDMAMAVLYGCTVQVVLLEAPLLVLVGGALSMKPFTLDFMPAEITSILMTAAVGAYVFQHGSSTYLDGVVLLGLYLILLSALETLHMQA